MDLWPERIEVFRYEGVIEEATTYSFSWRQESYSTNIHIPISSHSEINPKSSLKVPPPDFLVIV
jgi:hypothetical protein